jgi:hypothetical protein
MAVGALSGSGKRNGRRGGGSSGPYAQGGGGEGLKDVLHSSGESGTAAA